MASGYNAKILTVLQGRTQGGALEHLLPSGDFGVNTALPGKSFNNQILYSGTQNYEKGRRLFSNPMYIYWMLFLKANCFISRLKTRLVRRFAPLILETILRLNCCFSSLHFIPVLDPDPDQDPESKDFREFFYLQFVNSKKIINVYIFSQVNFVNFKPP